MGNRRLRLQVALWVGLDEEAVAPAAISAVDGAFWGWRCLSLCSALSTTDLPALWTEPWSCCQPYVKSERWDVEKEGCSH